MSRISRHAMWMKIAETASLRSTCYRGNVGAVIVRSNNILSIGYNGPAAGERHCTGHTCERTAAGGCERSLHAEANAIDRAISSIIDADLYVTDSPCWKCASYIFSSHISRVFYSRLYRNTIGLEFLDKGRIPAYQITPAGHIIDRNKELMPDDFE